MYRVDNSAGSGIINEKDTKVANQVHYLGKIDIEKYVAVTNKRILTDQVVLTDNRIAHIIERRGQKFYDEYGEKFIQVIQDPDFIFKDKKPDTAIVSKSFVSQNGNVVNIILRLAVEGDDPNYKNSIITAISENEKRFSQRLRNSIPLYKKLDNQE